MYEVFEAKKARSLFERFEIHYTPRHGSWLNMAEIKIGLLVRSCLNKRIESAAKMQQEVNTYLKQKNKNPAPIKWQFNNQDTRIKLHSRYPLI